MHLSDEVKSQLSTMTLEQRVARLEEKIGEILEHHEGRHRDDIKREIDEIKRRLDAHDQSEHMRLI